MRRRSFIKLAAAVAAYPFLPVSVLPVPPTVYDPANVVITIGGRVVHGFASAEDAFFERQLAFIENKLYEKQLRKYKRRRVVRH